MAIEVTPQKRVGGQAEAWYLDVTWTQYDDGESRYSFPWSSGLVLLIQNRDLALSRVVILVSVASGSLNRVQGSTITVPAGEVWTCGPLTSDGWNDGGFVHIDRSGAGNGTSSDIYLAGLVP